LVLVFMIEVPPGTLWSIASMTVWSQSIFGMGCLKGLIMTIFDSRYEITTRNHTGTSRRHRTQYRVPRKGP
jgi:hypothetical protein